MALKSKPLEAVRPSVPVHEVTKEELVRINFLVPASTRKRWKIAATEADRPLTEMLTEAMNRYLDEPMRK
jgi:hypothetical protein